MNVFDLDLTFDTLIGTGRNPNVAAAIVIGIEPNWTNYIADKIAGSVNQEENAGPATLGAPSRR